MCAVCVSTCHACSSDLFARRSKDGCPCSHNVIAHCNRGNLTGSIATRAVLRLRTERVTSSCNVYGELVIEVVAEHINQTVLNVSTTCVGARSLLVACFSASRSEGCCPIGKSVCNHCNRGNLTRSIATRAVLRLRTERVTSSCNVYGELVIEVVAEHINQTVLNVSTTCVGARSLLVACFSASRSESAGPITHFMAQCICSSIFVSVLTFATSMQSVTCGQTRGINYGRAVIVTACIDNDIFRCRFCSGVSICKILCARLAVPVFDITVLFAVSGNACEVRHRMIV